MVQRIGCLLIIQIKQSQQQKLPVGENQAVSKALQGWRGQVKAEQDIIMIDTQKFNVELAQDCKQEKPCAHTKHKQLIKTQATSNNTTMRKACR